MENVLHDKLLRRELGAGGPRSKVRGIYGDQDWVRDLDIVNELGGHNGCVNALNWSKGGGLLASGSDDQHLNIHSYQPEDSIRPFKFTTSVATGHEANIFSVKFMPHSSDRTVITAAGDADVRIFDIEHSGASARSGTGHGSNPASQNQGMLHHGIQYLSQGDTNARVYRSHSDRVKRIVTESSPHLFLTCSEDGEVRQWDLRQPSSAYPRPRGRRAFLRGSDDVVGDAPPALISYKKHRLDLNTISCSPSQPHYIALGGRHLHCFLHDRRMLGRSRTLERGSPGRSPQSNHDDNQMDEATQCVKRFAPNGKRIMKRNDDGHITACKISDTNPNDLIVSWSGDYVYEFDMMKVSDARDLPETSKHFEKSRRKAKESSDRKRKRAKTGSGVSQEGSTRSRQRRTPPEEQPGSDIALRVRYGNGQSENIPIESLTEGEETVEASISPEQQRSFRLASETVQIRRLLFTPEEATQRTEVDPTGQALSFSSALTLASSSLDIMRDIIRQWRYPVDPDEIDVRFQKTLKRNRESGWRLVQAAGTIARLLGGRITSGEDVENRMGRFVGISPAPNEGDIQDTERFRYDFIKAIILWLSSGPTALVEGFTQRANSTRFPIPANAGIEAIDEVLIPYLLQLAGDRPIPNVDASVFEVNQNRTLFDSERRAVIAFGQVVKVPFKDLVSSGSTMQGTSANHDEALNSDVAGQDRQTALRYWGSRVARGLLLNAGEGVNHVFVDRAFGGLGKSNRRIRAEEQAILRQTQDVISDQDEQAIDSIGIVGDGPTATEGSGVDADEEMVAIDDLREAVIEEEEENEGEDDEDDASVGSASEEDEDDSSDNEDDEADANEHLLFRSVFARTANRSRVKEHTPCAPHIRSYRGHCNVKTVKDVNFYGLNDEYVVSGSDSGHLFIWDRTSQELINILEGDGEVVNVIQGHPYEPMLAVSGIDHTVKIFSPDARMRRDARKGINLCNGSGSGYSSLRGGRRVFGSRPTRDVDSGPHATDAAVDAGEEDVTEDEDDNEVSGSGVRARRGVAANGLSSRRRMHMEYQITSQNDVERQGGNREGFVTRSMLAQFLSGLGGGGGDEEDEDGNDGDDGEGGGGTGGEGGFRLGVVGGRLVLRWLDGPPGGGQT